MRKRILLESFALFTFSLLAFFLPKSLAYYSVGGYDISGLYTCPYYSNISTMYSSGSYSMYGSGLSGMVGNGLYGIYGSGLSGMFGTGLYGIYGSGLYGMYGGLYGIYGSGLYGMYGGLYGMYGGLYGGLYGGNSGGSGQTTNPSQQKFCYYISQVTSDTVQTCLDSLTHYNIIPTQSDINCAMNAAALDPNYPACDCWQGLSFP